MPVPLTGGVAPGVLHGHSLRVGPAPRLHRLLRIRGFMPLRDPHATRVRALRRLTASIGRDPEGIRPSVQLVLELDVGPVALDARERLRAVPDDVAETVDVFAALSLDVRENRVKGGYVGVNVRNYGALQGWIA